MHVRFQSWCISLLSSVIQQRKMTKFYVFWRTQTAMVNIWGTEKIYSVGTFEGEMKINFLQCVVPESGDSSAETCLA